MLIMTYSNSFALIAFTSTIRLQAVHLLSAQRMYNDVCLKLAMI